LIIPLRLRDSEYEDELEYEYVWGTIAKKEKRASEEKKR
jgi:hypothetical protein